MLRTSESEAQMAGNFPLAPEIALPFRRPGDIIRFMSNDATYKVEEVGILGLNRTPCPELSAGSVGYIISGIKTVSDTRIGDTITLDDRPAPAPLPGFKEAKPVVFSSLYPMSSEDYQSLSEALE